jgi:phage I-like protein
MSAPQTLIQAALSRLAARVGSGLADSAAGLAALTQEAPARIQQELTLFWEEVEREAQRLERQDSGHHSGHAPGDRAPADPQDQIDALRAQVAALSRRLDPPPQAQR